MVITTVPVGGFASTDSGDAVLWDEGEASRLFTALSNDTPVPADVLDSQQ